MVNTICTECVRPYILHGTQSGRFVLKVQYWQCREAVWRPDDWLMCIRPNSWTNEEPIRLHAGEALLGYVFEGRVIVCASISYRMDNPNSRIHPKIPGFFSLKPIADEFRAIWEVTWTDNFLLLWIISHKQEQSSGGPVCELQIRLFVEGLEDIIYCSK